MKLLLQRALGCKEERKSVSIETVKAIQKIGQASKMGVCHRKNAVSEVPTQEKISSFKQEHTNFCLDIKKLSFKKKRVENNNKPIPTASTAANEKQVGFYDGLDPKREKEMLEIAGIIKKCILLF